MLTSSGSSKDTPPPASVEAFYDDFSRRFVEDIVQAHRLFERVILHVHLKMALSTPRSTIRPQEPSLMRPGQRFAGVNWWHWPE